MMYPNLCFIVFPLQDLKNVPSGLPSDIVKMDLSGNNITHLMAKQFLHSTELKLLNLSSNNLHNIDTGNPTQGQTCALMG